MSDVIFRAFLSCRVVNKQRQFKKNNNKPTVVSGKCVGTCNLICEL